MNPRISCLYEGAVVHTRLRPRRHRLRYRVFSLYLDLDELPELDRSLRLFSRNSFNLFSFHDRDHGDGSDTPLRAQIERHLHDAGIDGAGGPIRLMCMPRLLGYVFNPISVYYCHRRDGTLAALFYEVTNTFGQRHGYLAPAETDAGGVVRQSAPKELYVSPFMGMAMSYDFRTAVPGERLALAITGSDAQGPLIGATLAGRRKPLTDAVLAGAFLRFPFLTLKVVAGIHWEALKLWLKGVRLVPRPAPPSHPVTLGRSTLSRPPREARIP